MCRGGRAAARVVYVLWRGGCDDALLGARVDSIFAHLGPAVPGCALGVYGDGNIVLTRSYDIASAESGRPITARTTFNLGSAAKPITALAELLLEEQGRLSLDDDVCRYEFGGDSSAQITHFMIVTPSGVDVVRNLRFTGVR